METSLHRQLKERYAGDGAAIEQRVGRYRIDVVRGKQLIEIQLAPLASIRDKIAALLKKHDVLVVKPVIAAKHLVKRRRAGGQVISRRRSPKRRTLLDVFEELVHFTRVFPHRRLTLEVPLIEIEEWRYPGHGRRRWRRENDQLVEDQHLVDVQEVHRFRTAADLCGFLPPALSQPFHTGQLAEALGVERWVAQRMAYCLREIGRHLPRWQARRRLALPPLHRQSRVTFAASCISVVWGRTLPTEIRTTGDAMNRILPAPRYARYSTVAIAFLVPVLGVPSLFAKATKPTDAKRPPNIVIIFIDDMGYADIGPFGATAYKTPHLDQMAHEGRIFTDFHAATAVCSASRAGLMTGCYPERVSILGALGSNSKIGINADEITLGELCRSQGYATAIFGKWHLGHHNKFLPLQNGFDEYFGLPYSNDMSPLQTEMYNLPPKMAARKRGQPPLPLFENNKIVDSAVSPEKLAQLTTLYTEHAVSFIDRHKDQPFFLYVPHTMVHVPLAVSEKFKDKSGAGLFGDVVMELDWSVGQILDAVKRNGLDGNTFVLFTSDNGPWLCFGNHAGSALPLREGKGTMWEGGYREPCVMRWPGKIPAGSKCDELASTMDMFPTIAKLIGAQMPTDRVIDGKDIWPLISGEKGAKSPHDILYCYYDRQLRGVRDRRWKLVFPHQYRSLNGRPGGRDGIPVDYTQLKTKESLYDLKHDVSETTDLASAHPEIVARLEAEGEKARDALGDTLTGRKGSEVRPPGRVSD